MASLPYPRSQILWIPWENIRFNPWLNITHHASVQICEIRGRKDIPTERTEHTEPLAEKSLPQMTRMSTDVGGYGIPAIPMHPELSPIICCSSFWIIFLSLCFFVPFALTDNYSYDFPFSFVTNNYLSLVLNHISITWVFKKVKTLSFFYVKSINIK